MRAVRLHPPPAHEKKKAITLKVIVSRGSESSAQSLEVDAEEELERRGRVQ